MSYYWLSVHFPPITQWKYKTTIRLLEEQRGDLHLVQFNMYTWQTKQSWKGSPHYILQTALNWHTSKAWKRNGWMENRYKQGNKAMHTLNSSHGSLRCQIKQRAKELLWIQGRLLCKCLDTINTLITMVKAQGIQFSADLGVPASLQK